ncbi:Uncharacterised protein [Serratia quinivorans]|uniref:TIGR04255 family protein n=1 Tax=Serratia quinivorans TaxID=137545 RepID=UPI00217A8C68|nr:TIGR04255 family protein [Serratia quinivorans]CAI0837211.1 Uncharacterised protein [Serratia quinivorans]
MQIPTYLKSQPVIEAALEIRFNKETQISEIIPGYLFHSFNCKKPIVNLPNSQIPKNVRDADEQLHYSILHTLELEKYLVGISDHGIVISTNNFYDGWSEFKATITSVINALSKLNINDKIERIGMKYIDFFESKEKGECLFDKLNIEFNLAGESLNKNKLSLRLEKKDGDFSTIIQILSHARVLSDDGEFNKKGLILDIDTVKNLDTDKDVRDFIENTERYLNEIHDHNKITFFSCLKDSTIESLSPVYS